MNIEMLNQLWGRNHLMAMAAWRYCLGRQTYIVSDCVSWMLANWIYFSDDLRRIALEDITEAIEKDCAGSKMDVKEWKKILDLHGNL